MKAQIIERDSEPEWAVVPSKDYLRLVEAKEMLDDIAAFDDAVAATEEEIVPHTVVQRLIAGESPVRVWRQHRGMTQKELAESAVIGKAYLSQIEGGKRVGSATCWQRLRTPSMSPSRICSQRPLIPDV